MCAVVLGACSSKSDPGNTPESIPDVSQAQQLEQEVVPEQEVGFDFSFSALLSQRIETDSPNFLNDFSTQVNLINGSMQVDNLDDGTSESYAWTVNLDENDLANVQSLRTLQLKPGNYAFFLVLGSDGNQYVGETIFAVTDGAQELIPMIIRPVIGGQLIETNLVATLVDFEFNYSQSELAGAGLSDPSVGISIDGGTEVIFDVDPATGLSEHMNLNLSPGVYDIALRLYEAGAQVGKSVDGAGLDISITPGFDVSLDIVPLSGEVGVALAVEGGDAVFDVSVPNEVIEEAGGLANVEAVLTVVGATNALQEVTLDLNPASDGTSYLDTVTLSNMFFGDVDVELAFNELATSDSLGNCVGTVSLSDALNVFDCQLTLVRRSFVGGNILSSLGVTVIDESGAAVSGATISVDGVDVAITNSSAFSTPGYSKLLLTPGEHRIEASFGDDFGNNNYTAIPLNVDNIDLVLDKGVLLNDTFDGTATGSSVPVSYWYGGISQTSCPGTSHSGFLFLGSTFNDPATDWCERTAGVTSSNYQDSTIIDAGGFSVSVEIFPTSESNKEISIGVGGEVGSNPNNYNPLDSANALVTLNDNAVTIETFDGTELQSTTHAMPYIVDDVDKLTVYVETASFAAGASASIEIVINGDTSLTIPSASFEWDGGANHIQLVGAAGDPVAGSGTGYVYFDSLLIKPL